MPVQVPAIGFPADQAVALLRSVPDPAVGSARNGRETAKVEAYPAPHGQQAEFLVLAFSRGMAESSPERNSTWALTGGC